MRPNEKSLGVLAMCNEFLRPRNLYDRVMSDLDL